MLSLSQRLGSAAEGRLDHTSTMSKLSADTLREGISGELQELTVISPTDSACDACTLL